MDYKIGPVESGTAEEWHDLARRYQEACRILIHEHRRMLDELGEKLLEIKNQLNKGPKY